MYACMTCFQISTKPPHHAWSLSSEIPSSCKASITTPAAFWTPARKPPPTWNIWNSAVKQVPQAGRLEDWKTLNFKKLVGNRIQTNSMGRFRFRTENGRFRTTAEARTRSIIPSPILAYLAYPILSHFIPSLWSFLSERSCSKASAESRPFDSRSTSSPGAQSSQQQPIPLSGSGSGAIQAIQSTQQVHGIQKQKTWILFTLSFCLHVLTCFVFSSVWQICFLLCSYCAFWFDGLETAALESIPSAPFLHILHASASEFFRAAFQSLQSRPSYTVSCHEGTGMNWPCRQSITTHDSMTSYYLLNAECFEGSDVSILSPLKFQENIPKQMKNES